MQKMIHSMPIFLFLGLLFSNCDKAPTDVKAILDLNGRDPESKNYCIPYMYDPVYSDSTGTYTIRWSKIPNAGTYTIQESKNPYFQDSREFTTSDTLSDFTYAETSRIQYYYRVRSDIVSSVNDWSNTVYIVISPNSGIFLIEIPDLPDEKP